MKTASCLSFPVVNRVARALTLCGVLGLANVSVFGAEEGGIADNPLLGCWLVEMEGFRHRPLAVEWEFTPETVIVRDLLEEREVSRSAYKFDLNKDPSWIDTVSLEDGVLQREGVFQVENDELQVRFAPRPGNQRPKLLGKTFLKLARQHEPKDPIVIEGPAEVRDGQALKYLVVQGTNTSFEIACIGRLSLVVDEVEPDVHYRLTVVEEAVYSTSYSPELVRLERDGQVLYDREICGVHGVKMSRERVPVHFGLIEPLPDEPSYETERVLFPHRRSFRLGGCSAYGPDVTLAFVCGRCREAYLRWKVENPGPGPPSAVEQPEGL